MAAINQEIDFETASKVAEKFEVTAYKEEVDDQLDEFEEEEIEGSENLEKRPPIITVMGHVGAW